MGIRRVPSSEGIFRLNRTMVGKQLLWCLAGLKGSDCTVLVSTRPCIRGIHAHAHGLPRWLSGKESSCQCRRCRGHGFSPWVGKISWGRKWLPTPVFLRGKSQGQRTLAGYSPWGHKELDTTEYQLMQWEHEYCLIELL